MNRRDLLKIIGLAPAAPIVAKVSRFEAPPADPPCKRQERGVVVSVVTASVAFVTRDV